MRTLHIQIVLPKETFAFICAVLCFGALAGRNYFSPYVNSLKWNSKPVCLSHEGVKPNVPQFEMLELGFELPSSIEAMIEQPHPAINPFDPDDINVVAVFSNGKISDTVFGFYYRDYVRDVSTIKPVFENCPTAKWNEEFTAYKWRVRYAPADTGNWTVSIKVILGTVPAVTHSIDPLSFHVVLSTHGGFLALGSDRRHFIESGSKTSFFLLGQDIAWPDGERFRGGPNPKYPGMVAGGYMDMQDWIVDLSRNGGNTIRVVKVPWSYEYEWDTIGTYNMAHAWELDSLFRVCESHRIKMVFCFEHGTYTLPPWYEEHLTWEKNPYNRFIPGVDMPDDFLTDSTARAAFRKKMRYFFARWGYSTSLGVFQILSEMDNWTHRDGPLPGNKNAQRNQLAWHNEMLAFAKAQVSYRPLLTNTSFGAPPRECDINAYSSPYIDIVCPRHCYFTERNDNLKRWKEINSKSLADPGVHTQFPDKAVMIDEMGMGAFVGDPGDMDKHSDVVYHNSMWATAFSGTGGAGLYWWSWNSNEYRAANFPALSAFFKDIDFESDHYIRPGHWEDAGRASKVKIETFYIGSDDAERSHCIGWVHNASYWWGNVVGDFKDRNGKVTAINSRTGDDADIAVPTELAAGTKFEVHDLANGTEYGVSWYETRREGGYHSADGVRTNIFGTAKIAWKPGKADWAFRIKRLLNKFDYRFSLKSDTLLSEGVVQAHGNHPLDSNGTFTYHWDFGNGIIADQRNAEVTYTPGTYNVTLTCVDGAGKKYRMKQEIVVVGESVNYTSSFSENRRLCF